MAVGATRRRAPAASAWAAALIVSVLVPGIQLVASGPAEAAGTTARVVRWVDGDTVETTRGTVRLIGIDTPERGDCGSGAATRHAQAIAPAGSRVLLGNPASVVDRDKYGRNLRYVATPAGRDVGLAQIRDGARARYDSRDGYQWHRQEAAYHRADSRDRDYRCAGDPRDQRDPRRR
jgi:micrococcal nuclease